MHGFPTISKCQMRSAILRKLITVNTCFLQLHVPYTLGGAIAILKFVETGLIFCNDKSFNKIGILHLDALRCKFTIIQYVKIEGLK